MAINTTFGAFLQLTLSLFNAVTEFTLMFSRGGEPLNSSEKATALFLLSSIATMTMEEIKVEYQEGAIFDPITKILNEHSLYKGQLSSPWRGTALY